MSFSRFDSLDEVYAATEMGFCQFWQQKGYKLGFIKPQDDAVIEVLPFCKIVAREVICRYKKKNDDWWRPKRRTKTCIAAIMFRSCVSSVIITSSMFTFLGEQRFLEVESYFIKKMVHLPLHIYMLKYLGVFVDKKTGNNWLAFLLINNYFDNHINIQNIAREFLDKSKILKKE